MLGPVDVTAWRRAGVVGGRGGGGRGGGGGGGGRRAGRRAARGQGVCPPVPARRGPQTAVGAMTLVRALVLPRVVARLRHGPPLLPPGVSEVHLLHTARCPEAVVMRSECAEVVSGHPLLQTRPALGSSLARQVSDNWHHHVTSQSHKFCRKMIGESIYPRHITC